MKYFVTFLFLFSRLLSDAQSKIDVLHYKFDIELNDINDSIRGIAEIKVKFLESTDNLQLDLKSPAENGKGMSAGKAFEPYVKRILQLNEAITILLSKFFNKGDTATFTIPYSGIPSDGLIISKNKYGNRTFFADNWPDRAHNWIPCVDDPADKASVEFLVTAPSHYQVVSNGELVEETNLPNNKKLTHYKEDMPLPTKIMVIGVADFAVEKVGTPNCIPVTSWVFPENKKEGFYDYAIAKDILSFFIDYIGPYPFKKLANVQSKTIFGGMENAGAIFYSENSITGNRQNESLMAHEITHQWFGDMATEKSFAHLWLSEGFATYLAHLYEESKYGTERFIRDMKSERDEIIDFVKTSRKPVVDSVSPYMQLLNTNSYQKGSWVLHMLRRELGDSVFKKSIRLYYSTYAGKNADTKDLQKVIENVSGKNLEQFFTQWLYTPENLQLDIKWKYNKAEKNVSITVKQLQSVNFQFPLEFLIQDNIVSIPKRMTKTISKNIETFTFRVQSKPIKFEIDPMVSLLFEGKVTELK